MTGDSRIPRSPAPLPASGTWAAQIGAPPATGENKAALRRALLAARAAITPVQKAQWDAAIGAAVLQWWRAQAAGASHGAAVLGVYWPLRGEPDLATAYAELARSGVRLALPVVLARDSALGFAFWQPGEPMTRDAMGVAVPAQLRAAPMPQALLAPCLGFNRQGYRLGYGGGYYDRTLEQTPRPATAGIAYACQAAAFAVLAHDVALDVVITENGIAPADPLMDPVMDPLADPLADRAADNPAD